MVQDHITQNGDEWEGILLLREPAFRELFTVKGNALKNVPARYEKEHPQAEYLKYKSWNLEYPLRDGELRDRKALLAKAAELFRTIKPFNDYLNRALASFRMPESR